MVRSAQEPRTKDLQDLIGVAVGFLGVIATLIVTAWLAKRQQRHEAEIAREQRELWTSAVAS